MADSPSKYKDRIVAWTINCDGKALDDSYKLVYAQVHLAINRIGKATLNSMLAIWTSRLLMRLMPILSNQELPYALMLATLTSKIQSLKVLYLK